ncbi:MAG TPA: hypothetical protein VFM18_10055 [Methanosarcina sp.]|nr:hypothetical protein [Methanosarcina sp.]
MATTTKAVKKVDPMDILLKEMRKLSKQVTILEERLTKHMDDETGETKEINERLGQIVSQITDLYNAMPVKDGKADFYGHRVDHEKDREERKIQEEKKTWLNKIMMDIKGDVIKYVVGGFLILCLVGIIALITNDKASGILKAFFELAK